MPATATLTIGRWRCQAAPREPVIARLAAQDLAAAVGDALPPLPPQSLLLVRRLRLALPVVDVGRRPDASQRSLTTRRSRGLLAAAYADAQHPARQQADEWAPAIFFADEAELLACLARDAVAGRLGCWWWHSVLDRQYPDWTSAWRQRPAANAAALHLLAHAGLREALAAALPIAATKTLAGATAAATPPTTATPPARRAAPPGSAPSPLPSAAAAAATTRSGSPAGDSRPAQPPSATPPLTTCDVQHRLAAYQRSPADAGEAGAAADLALLPAAVARTNTPPVAGNRAPAAMPLDTAADKAAVAPPTGARGSGAASGTAAPGNVATAAALPAAPVSDAAAGRRSAPVGGAPPAPPVLADAAARVAAAAPWPAARSATPAATALGEQPAGERSLLLADDSVLPPGSAWRSPPADSRPPVAACSTPPAKPPALAAAASDREPAARCVPASAPAAEAMGELPFPSLAAMPQPVFTQCARLLFLVNLLLGDGLYPDFTRPAERGFPVPLWRLLALLGASLAGPDFRHDPLAGLLDELASEIEPAPAPTAAELARHWPPRSAPGARRRRAATLRRQPAHAFARWFASYGRALRWRLAVALSVAPSRVGRQFWQERGEACVWLTAQEVVAVLPLADHPVAWRLAGLDRDPGFLPSTGRSLRFVFE